VRAVVGRRQDALSVPLPDVTAPPGGLLLSVEQQQRGRRSPRTR
jgi:hypothetical protein